jgi:Flp pilus assembly protein TadG
MRKAINLGRDRMKMSDCKPKNRRVLRIPALVHTEFGGAALEFAVVVPVLVLLAIGAVDFGRAYYTGITVSSAARTGAQYGTQDVGHSTDNAGMIAAARNDADDQTLSVTPTTYCRCPDGTDPGCTSSPTCPGYGDARVFVKVTVMKKIGMILRYPGMRDSLVFRDSTTLRAY